MKYVHNKLISNKSAKSRILTSLLTASLMVTLGMGFGNVSTVGARGQNGKTTSKVGTIIACTSTAITVSVDTTINDRVNQYLIQADGINVYQSVVGRRTVTLFESTGSANTRWSGWRQERDSWLPDFSVNIDPVTQMCIL